jgi:predicted transcriptional regulator
MTFSSLLFISELPLLLYLENLTRQLLITPGPGDTSHSELTKNVNKRYAKHPHFETILKEVSVYNVPHGMEQGTYTLKPECWKEFDRFYVHYNQKDLQTAEERFREYKKQASDSSNFGVNTTLFTKIYPTFARVITVLHSDVLHAAIFSVLYHVVSETTSKSSEALVAEAIHLLELSIRSLVLFPELRAHLLSQQGGVNKQTNKASGESSYFPFDTIQFTSGYILVNALQLTYVPKAAASTSSSAPSGLAVDEQESILSLLFKLTHKQESEYKSTVQSLLTLFSELDPPSKSALDEMGEKMEQLQSQSATSAVERKRKARERQAAILASFQKQQQAFKFLEEEEAEDKPTTSEEPTKQGAPAEVEFSTECALCKEPSNSLHHRPVGYVAFIQRSRVLTTAKNQILAKQENKKYDITPPVLNRHHSLQASPARTQEVAKGSENVFSSTGTEARRNDSSSDEEGTDTDDFLHGDDGE